MALFTDGPVSGIEDLAAQDSQLLEVANIEAIDVTRKLALAQDELGVELSMLLARLSFVDQPFWLSPKPNLGSVVVTPPLKLWHTYRALEMVYKDAYNSQLNDRYAGKRDQFRLMAQWASEKLIQIGIGVAPKPVPQAATPEVLPIPGALPDGTYYVTVAWVNDAGEEGASAVPAVVTIAGSTLEVRPGAPLGCAVGWSVYIGGAPESMVQQNGSPIGTGQTWQQPEALATAGRAPSAGQEPTYLKPIPRVIQRG